MNRDELKEIVTEALDERIKDFYIDRERHYKHHLFIERLEKWADRCTSTFLKTVVQCVVGAILTLIVIGYIAWGAKHFKG